MTKVPIIESYWVKENRFLAGEYPGGYDSESTRPRINAFLETGVNSFIDLTHTHELTSYENVLKEQASIYKLSGVYHRFSIRDHHVPSSETMITILDTIDDELKMGHNIYVHCWGGVGRTGIVVACYLVRHGSSNEQALLQVNKLYKSRPNNPYYPQSPESNAQIEFVSNWHE